MDAEVQTIFPAPAFFPCDVETEAEAQPSVTPSPESMTVPVSDRSDTFEDVQDAASASTACTAMYKPAQLKDSNMISAVFSRFSGGFKG